MKDKTISNSIGSRAIIALLLAVGILAPRPADACSVPVFRYALIYWPADYYDAVVIHRGPLTPAQTQMFEGLKEQSEPDLAMLNLSVAEVDLEEFSEEKLKSVLGDELPQELPSLALWYPQRQGTEAPVFVRPFTSEAVSALTDSPARQELAKRLVEGHSTVWVFLASGDAEKDEAARKVLREQLATAEGELNEMPPAELEDGSAVTYKFSILEIDRADPEEAVFIELLMGTEDDLHELKDEPMVFPAFGRGRILYALVGEGIREDNLYEAISFVSGPCGCQIKALNPGTDMLLACDWESAMEEMDPLVEDQPLPELFELPTAAAATVATPGIEAAEAEEPSASSETQVASAAATDPPVNTTVPQANTTVPPVQSMPASTPRRDTEAIGVDPMLRNVAIAIVLAAIVVLGGTLLLRKKG